MLLFDVLKYVFNLHLGREKIQIRKCWDDFGLASSNKISEITIVHQRSNCWDDFGLASSNKISEITIVHQRSNCFKQKTIRKSFVSKRSISDSCNYTTTLRYAVTPEWFLYHHHSKMIFTPLSRALCTGL